LVERESKLIAIVAPGLAYSASGEILLRSGQGLIEVPLSEQPLALVLTSAGAACATADGDDGACLFGERAGEADIAELRWMDARRVDRRHDVLLAWVVTEDLDALPDGLDAGLSNRAVYVADRKAIVALCPISQGE